MKRATKLRRLDVDVAVHCGREAAHLIVRDDDLVPALGDELEYRGRLRDRRVARGAAARDRGLLLDVLRAAIDRLADTDAGGALHDRHQRPEGQPAVLPVLQGALVELV